jgi:hypothetical protein
MSSAPISSAPVASAPTKESDALIDLEAKRAILKGLACKVVEQLTEIECDIHLGLLRRRRRPARSESLHERKPYSFKDIK